MFRGKKNSFVSPMKFVQNLVIFLGFTLLSCQLFYKKMEFLHSKVVVLALIMLLLKKF